MTPAFYDAGAAFFAFLQRDPVIRRSNLNTHQHRETDTLG